MNETPRLAETKWGDFWYWPQDCIGKFIAEGRFWDRHLKAAFDEVPAGSLVVDVGANLGWFTVYAAKRGCRVVAFEPCQAVLELLDKNIALNQVEDLVRVERLALYDSRARMARTPELLEMYESDSFDPSTCKNCGALMLIPEAAGAYEARTLDSFGLEGVALLKTDAQGCDLAILRGAVETIKRSHPVICYESFRNPQDKAERERSFQELLASLGYETEVAYESEDHLWSDHIARPVVKEMT
jgi:FkbM family methyltransferase